MDYQNAFHFPLAAGGWTDARISDTGFALRISPSPVPRQWLPKPGCFALCDRRGRIQNNRSQRSVDLQMNRVVLASTADLAKQPASESLNLFSGFVFAVGVTVAA